MTKLPNGWEVKKLGEIAKITSGGTPNRSKNEFWGNGSIPWVKIKDMKEDYIKSTEEFITDLGLSNSSAKLFPKGTLLYSIFATLGEVGILDINAATNQAIAGITIKQDDISTVFMMYYLKSIKNEVIKKGRGVAQNNLNISMLKELEVPLPSLEEQRKIVKILDEKFASIDESIRLAKVDLLNLDELWQSILNDSFNPLKSKLDNVKYPKTWEVKKLKDIAKIKGGKRLPKGEKLLDNKTDYCYIRVSDFNNYGTIDIDSVKYINFDIYDKLKNYSINHKNLYISIAGTIGKTGIIPKELDGSILTENAVKLEYLQDNINNDFIYYFTLSESFKNQIFDYTKTVAQPKLAITRLKELKIPLPSLEEQERIAKELESKAKTIKELKELYTKRLKDYEELKESLLDLAFKGGL